MKREDLFLAIGAVEDERLLRSEWSVREPSLTVMEEPKMKKARISKKRLLRNVLVAALIVSTLAVTVLAATGYLLFGGPEEMIAALFGDSTGYDHSEGNISPDPNGPPTGIIVEPTFDRVPADETVVAEDIAPHVDAVGQSISWEGYTLTVDAVMYDSATGCGFFTYLLENPDGVGGYKLQSNGEIWYDGAPDIVSVNRYGYPFIIRERTTDTCLAATYYFQDDHSRNEDLEISFTGDETVIPDEQVSSILTQIEKELREELTPQQAVDAVIELIGAAVYEENTSRTPDGSTIDLEASRVDYAYTVLTHERFKEAYRNTGTKLTVRLPEESVLRNVTAENGSIQINPIAIQIDVTNLTFLHEAVGGEPYIHGDNVDSVVIRYRDGSEYVVDEGYTCNYSFAIIGSATDYEEDTNHLLTYMFNRIIDVDAVESVILNGREILVR